ncbi:hypothetical protein T265_02004 [Opisthorchis viverrini]|uniref:Uncharacterized protein n=1 Tax=Opisthorchis viverrini TaxID=6198 RepID=A0A074ZWD7_OPIVI|nr:hypothetical protein T265_02004 [Opisthorchis viverrini]KER31768.1 hypothetical protein T265_02004 [Opisthorchis viverrini]
MTLSFIRAIRTHTNPPVMLHSDSKHMITPGTKDIAGTVLGCVPRAVSFRPTLRLEERRPDLLQQPQQHDREPRSLNNQPRSSERWTSLQRAPLIQDGTNEEISVSRQC